MDSQDFNGTGYFYPGRPNALRVHLKTAYFISYANPFVYELDSGKLNIYGTIWYGPNGHPCCIGGSTTQRSFEKVDSLRQLISPGQLDLRLEGNRLIVSRKDVSFQALFMAD